MYARHTHECTQASLAGLFLNRIIISIIVVVDVIVVIIITFLFVTHSHHPSVGCMHARMCVYKRRDYRKSRSLRRLEYMYSSFVHSYSIESILEANIFSSSQHLY